MVETFQDLPRWKFEVDEVSAGVYEIVGTDDRGRRVQFKGTDPEALLEQARTAAAAISRS
jgi:hypothetical protein